jgi:hypothetical protein
LIQDIEYLSNENIFVIYFPLIQLVIAGYQAYNRSVVSKLDDGFGVVQIHAVMDEQGVQQRTEDTPLEGSCVNSQSWVNREYSRGLRTHPWRAPVLIVSRG